MYFSTLKRRSLIFITMLLTMFLALMQGNLIPPARALGGRRKVQAGGMTGPSGEKLQGLPRLPAGIRKKRNSGQAKDKEPDHNPSLTRDDQGNAYLVWEHGNEIFWAINQGGNWTRTGKMPGEGGNRPVVIFVPPRLFCAWESFTTPKKIMGSTGTLTEDGEISWSEPQALTGDSNDDYGISLTMDSGNNPLMLWLQRASLEDDADLYYQIITSNGLPLVNGNQEISSEYQEMISSSPGPSGSGAGDRAPTTAPVAAEQEQGTAAAPADNGRAAPSPSADDGALDPPSNWVGQAPPAISLTGPLGPFFNSPCISIVLTQFNINLPVVTPICGETVGVRISNILCGTSGITPCDSSPVLTPAVSDELVTELTLGPHLSLGFTLFDLGQAAISTNASTNASPAQGRCSAVQQTVCSYGGSDSFLWLSSPFPLVVCGDQIGITRVGAAGAVGISYSSVRSPNNPETPRAFVTQIAAGMGPQANFSAFQDKFQGFVIVGGGYSFTHTLSAQGCSFTSGPAIAVRGALRFGGDWAALLYRFSRTYTPGQWRDPNASSCQKRRPWWADLNSFYFKRISPWLYRVVYGGYKSDPSRETAGLSDPNFLNNQENLSPSPKPLMVESGKDRLRKTITRIMSDGNALVDEVLDMVKEPLIGTGGVYEGKTVLGDISSDIYNDGLAAVARSRSGEIMAVWAKALEVSSLGSKIYAATYTGGSWSSPVEVTPEIDFHQHPALVFDSRGTPLAVWSSSSNDGLDYERSSVEAIFQAFGKSGLLYSQRIDGQWTLPKPLAKLPGTSEQVALAAGSDGEITAVWINRSDKGSCVCGSLWNGSQWSEPRVISRAALAESPAVIYTARKPSAVWAQDMDGRAVTANDWRICTASWDGTSWHSRQLSIGEESPAEEEKEQTILPGRQKDIFPSGRRLKDRAGRRRSTAAALRN
ncbi:MAG: hypothetical protein AB1611_21110 [bacterium]